MEEDIVWDGCLKQQETELQRIHNFAARIISGADRHTPSKTLLQDLGMVPLSDKRKIHQAVFIHKTINGRGPEELCSRLQNDRPKGGFRLRSREALSITPRQHHTAKYERSTLYRSIKVWNTTNANIRKLENSSKFKTEVQRVLACVPKTLIQVRNGKLTRVNAE